MTGQRSGIGIVARALAVAAVVIAATAGVAWAASQGLPQAQQAPAAAKPAGRSRSWCRTSATRRSSSRRARSRRRASPGASRAASTASRRTPSSPSRRRRARASSTPARRAVTLTLERTRGYPQAGEPADTSPYAATKIRLAGAVSVAQAAAGPRRGGNGDPRARGSRPRSLRARTRPRARELPQRRRGARAAAPLDRQPRLGVHELRARDRVVRQRAARLVARCCAAAAAPAVRRSRCATRPSSS